VFDVGGYAPAIAGLHYLRLAGNMQTYLAGDKPPDLFLRMGMSWQNSALFQLKFRQEHFIAKHTGFMKNAFQQFFITDRLVFIKPCNFPVISVGNNLNNLNLIFKISPHKVNCILQYFAG